MFDEPLYMPFFKMTWELLPALSTATDIEENGDISLPFPFSLTVEST